MHTYYVNTHNQTEEEDDETEKKKTHCARVMEGIWLGWNINTYTKKTEGKGMIAI